MWDWEPQAQQQQQQQHASTVQQISTGPVQSVAYIVPSPYHVPSTSVVYERYDSVQSMVAGVILIIAGALSIIFNIVGIFIELFAIIGHGIWCGVMFIVAGAFGVAAARKRRCLVITFMVLAIISASMALVMFALSMAGALYIYYWHVGVMNLLMAITAVVAGTVAIWGSVIGCKVTCCKGGTSTAPMTVGSGQPLVVYTQQQQQPQLVTGAIPVGAAPWYPTDVSQPPQLTSQTVLPAYNQAQ